MSNASMRVKGLGEIDRRIIDKFLQFGHLPHLLKGEHLIFPVSVDSQTSGIITAILEAQQACSMETVNRPRYGSMRGGELGMVQLGNWLVKKAARKGMMIDND
jgi:hypothetical protein